MVSLPVGIEAPRADDCAVCVRALANVTLRIVQVVEPFVAALLANRKSASGTVPPIEVAHGLGGCGLGEDAGRNARGVSDRQMPRGHLHVAGRVVQGVARRPVATDADRQPRAKAIVLEFCDAVLD